MLHEQYYIEKEKQEKLIAKKNRKQSFYNGVFQRYEDPVLTRDHVPLTWKYDLNPETNPLFIERLGVNAVMNSGALLIDGRVHLVVRVEGNDRKSFFAIAESDSGVDGFCFRDFPLELPDTCPDETNVYDMRLTRHEDGYIYGVFCSESKDHSISDLSAATAAAGIIRTKDLRSWERLDNLITLGSPQQRNVVLHPEFVNGQYAFYTRPMDSFIETGSGGGIGFGLCPDICHAVIAEEKIISPRQYHTITESKNGAGAVPIKTERGWVHIAHGVRNTAAGLRYVLYAFATDLDDPARVIARPSGMLLGPLEEERTGDVSNVVFTNGAVVRENGEVLIYYASSDTRMHVAATTLERLVDYVFNTPEDPLRSALCVRQRRELIEKNMDFLKREAVFEAYRHWCSSDVFDQETKEELKTIKNEEEIMDRFCRELEFGTGGLRGIIGAGTNRMNIYTVRKATQGLAEYIKKSGKVGKGAVIAYDSRHMSREFARQTACCLAANGIRVWLFDDLRPTPELSYALRKLGAVAGVVITASHNPPQYNGYKVYWEDGAQITAPTDKEIIEEVKKINSFASVQTMAFDEARKLGLIQMIGDAVDRSYLDELKKLVHCPQLLQEQGKSVRIVYSPLHGTGLMPVTRVLAEAGFLDVHVVPEQEVPDGQFPTVKSPNPEEQDAFEMALKLARECSADLVLATDPDADRLGVYVKDENVYRALSGNMSGMLICEYELEMRQKNGNLPKDGAVVSTIVSTNMARQAAEKYGVKYIETLTGFKYIGEQIRRFEEQGTGEFLFGFEESYGCLAGTYARDKDAVIAALKLCEAAVWYRSQGRSLWQQMMRLYEQYGFYKEALMTVTFTGEKGAAKMAAILSAYRENIPAFIGPYQVKAVRDYKKGVRTELPAKIESEIHLPQSDVLYFELEDDSWFCVRPSGTEPKIKYYIGVRGVSMEAADVKIERLTALVKEQEARY